jgi:leader peptidase (prepilin peptidase) / N-methyltransferase
MEILVGVLFGLIIGSFLNVCIHRMPRDLSVVRPRSFCPACKTPIAWYDNFPLLSYALLRGKCRHCFAGIPARYPIVEALTAVSFALAMHHHGATPTAFKACLFSALLIGLIFSDFEQLILPDEFTIGGAAAGLVLAWFVPLDGLFARLMLPSVWNERAFSLTEAMLGALVSGGALWLVGELYYRIRKREGLGFGDVKMVAMIGAFLGLQGSLFTLLIGSLAGSVLGLLFILIARKDFASYELPFGSFLGAGALLVGVWGPALLDWPRSSGI